jgi:hypothetical protein
LTGLRWHPALLPLLNGRRACAFLSLALLWRDARRRLRSRRHDPLLPLLNGRWRCAFLSLALLWRDACRRMRSQGHDPLLPLTLRRGEFLRLALPRRHAFLPLTFLRREPLLRLPGRRRNALRHLALVRPLSRPLGSLLRYGLRQLSRPWSLRRRRGGHGPISVVRTCLVRRGMPHDHGAVCGS